MLCVSSIMHTIVATRLPTTVPSADGAPLSPVAVVAELRPFLRAVCHRLTTSSDDAEEVLQDTLMVIVEQLPRFRGASSLKTWAFAIARSQANRRYRRRRPSLGVRDNVEDGRAVDWRDTADLHTDLERALGVLSDVDRRIVLRCLGDGVSSDEIAAELGTSVGAVKSRLHRARVVLRSRMSAERVPLAA